MTGDQAFPTADWNRMLHKLGLEVFSNEEAEDFVSLFEAMNFVGQDYLFEKSTEPKFLTNKKD